MKRSKIIALLMLVALLLGACSNAAEPTPSQAPTQVQPTATERAAASAPTDVPTAPAPTATQPLPTATTPADAPPPTDTPAAEDILAFLEVKPDDWVRGPDDAEVTIIEYADFQ